MNKKPTHYLYCRHCTNAKSCIYYKMECVLLKNTKSRKAKILVFGERYNRDRNKQRIRYVDISRLEEINEK